MTSIFSSRIAITINKQQQDCLLLFVSTNHVDSDDLSVAIESAIERQLVPDSVIVLARESVFQPLIYEFNRTDELIAAVRRLGSECQVRLFYYDATGQISSARNVEGVIDGTDVDWNSLKRRAVTDIFRRNGGFVESTDVFHFENPSKRHTARFIRLSNILVDAAEIAFIAFCSLLFVPRNATIAYIDSPSLYAVVASMNEQIQSLDESRRFILAENFQSYVGVEQYPFRKIAECFVIISASSSGAMSEVIQERHQISRDRIFHVLYLGEGDRRQRVVCNLLRDNRNPRGYPRDYGSVSNSEDCSLCAKGSIPIVLQGDQFQIPGPQHEPYVITRDDAPKPTKDVFHRLAGKEVLAVGLGGARDNAPRQYYIDAKRYLELDGTKANLAYLLNRTVPAATKFVISLNESSVALAEQVLRRCNPGDVRLLNLREIDQIPRDTTSTVVVAAAVIESGRSLQDLSRDLRTICPESPLVYIVGIAKANEENRREKLTSTLTESNKKVKHFYAHLEQLQLPPSKSDNAWWRELTALREPSFLNLLQGQEVEVVGERIARLERSGDPLVDDLFLANDGITGLKLQPGFVFWHPGYEDCSQADVFFTVASIFQELRKNQKIRSNPFQQSILHPMNFGRFNDGVVQASILRAASARELNLATSPVDSEHMAKIIRRVLASAARMRGEAAAEFMLAIVTRRLSLHPRHLATIAGRYDFTGLPMLAALHRGVVELNRKLNAVPRR